MRVADKTTQRNYLRYLNNARTNYAETNMKIASGNRFIELSDDVSAGTRMLNSRVELFKSEKQLSNVQAINSEFKAVEDSMMSMNDVLNEIIGTKLIRASSETVGDTGRVTIAAEIKSMKEELIQFANMKFATKYPFGGSTAKTAPFSLSDDGRLLYNGIDVDTVQQRADGSRYYVDENGNIEITLQRVIAGNYYGDNDKSYIYFIEIPNEKLEGYNSSFKLNLKVKDHIV